MSLFIANSGVTAEEKDIDAIFLSCIHFIHNATVSLLLLSFFLPLIYLFSSSCFSSFSRSFLPSTLASFLYLPLVFPLSLGRWSAWWRHAAFSRQTDAITLNRHASWGQGPGKKMLSAGGKIRDGFCNIHETNGIRTELLIAWFTSISWECYSTGYRC